MSTPTNPEIIAGLEIARAELSDSIGVAQARRILDLQRMGSTEADACAEVKANPSARQLKMERAVAAIAAALEMLR